MLVILLTSIFAATSVASKVLPKNAPKFLQQAYAKFELQVGQAMTQQNLDAVPGTPYKDYPMYDGIDLVRIKHKDCNERKGKLLAYYTLPELECQGFQICGLDGEGGLINNGEFLCPNGTIFNQEYFICDWWFNFDCDEAPDFIARQSGNPESSASKMTKTLKSLNRALKSALEAALN